MITNYHVLTGKEPFTGRQVLPQPDTIQVVFYTVNGIGYYIKKFPLYQNGKPLFYTLSKNFDVAVIPIDIDSSCNSIKQFISVSDLDMRKSIAPGNQLLIVGFPANCQTNNIFRACTFSSTSIKPLDFKPYSVMLFFNIVMGKGSSGSPIYILDRSKKRIEIIGINSMGNIMDIDHSSVGLYSFYIKQIIDKIIK